VKATPSIKKVELKPTARVIDATTAELADQVREVLADVIVEYFDGQLAGKEPPEWLTRSEVATYLRVSVAQVDILSRRAVDPLPFEVVGEARRYNRADVRSWIRMQRRGGQR
jgi:hypothetical protein